MPTVTYEVRGVEVRITCQPDELEDVLATVDRRAEARAANAPTIFDVLGALRRPRAQQSESASASDDTVKATHGDRGSARTEAVPSGRQAVLDGDNAYVRKEVIKQVLLEAGTPLSPKEIADRLRERDDFEMEGSSDWIQGVRYVLTRAYKDEFESPVRGKWRIADAAAPEHEQSTLSDTPDEPDDE